MGMDSRDDLKKDNPNMESVNVSEATNLINTLLQPESAESEKETQQDEEIEKDEPLAESEEEEAQEEELIAIEVDGKEVQLTKSELAEHYKNGLRQSDYTKKTMEAAEQRKAAEAELSAAKAEREQYSQKLIEADALLKAQLQEQNAIDWAKLLQDDLLQYLDQRRIFEERQAAMQQVTQEKQRLEAVTKQENDRLYREFIQNEAKSLLDKLPAWKDQKIEAKEKAEILKFLKNEGYSDEQISQVADHRAVVIARKAMLYDQLIAKSPDVTKRVEKAPVKVERSTVGEKSNDNRTKEAQRFGKTRTITDAASLIKNIL